MNKLAASILYTALLALGSCGYALAQGEDELTPLGTYDSAAYGFSIPLPLSGILLDPSSEGWDEDPETAFTWEQDEAAPDITVPVELILGRADLFDNPLDETSIADFKSGMTGYFGEEPGNFAIINDQDAVEIGGYSWGVLEIEDTSDKSSDPIYYTICYTYEGSATYSFIFYYHRPADDPIIAFAYDVLGGFAVGVGEVEEAEGE